MDRLCIRDDSIRLGQALKLHGVADDGYMAKALIQDGHVTVNDEVETRRGATLRVGDRIEALGVAFEIAREP